MKIFYCEFIDHLKDPAKWFKWATSVTPFKPDPTVVHFPTPLTDDEFYITESKDGYKVNVSRIEEMVQKHPDMIVLTNLPYLLSHEYAWNEKEGKSEIYLWSDIDYQDGFRSVHDLTNRDIRNAHNIEKKYRSGEFDHDEYKYEY